MDRLHNNSILLIIDMDGVPFTMPNFFLILAGITTWPLTVVVTTDICSASMYYEYYILCYNIVAPVSNGKMVSGSPCGCAGALR